MKLYRKYNPTVKKITNISYILFSYVFNSDTLMVKRMYRLNDLNIHYTTTINKSREMCSYWV